MTQVTLLLISYSNILGLTNIGTYIKHFETNVFSSQMAGESVETSNDVTDEKDFMEGEFQRNNNFFYKPSTR